MLKACFVGVLLGAASMLWAQAPQRQPSAQLIGIVVQKELPEDSREFRFAGEPGTTVRVLFSLPGQNIISLDREASKLTKFVDDKGTDLRKGEAGFGHFPEPSEDHQKMMIELHGGVAPAAGASKVIVQASVSFHCGSDPKTETQKDIALKDGTKVQAGEVAFTIEDMKANKEDPQKVTFMLKTQQFPGAVTKTEFFGVDGKPLNAELGMTGYAGGDGNARTYMAEYTLPKTDAVNIQFTYYSKVQQVTVPVTIETGIGF